VRIAARLWLAGIATPSFHGPLSGMRRATVAVVLWNVAPPQAAATTGKDGQAAKGLFRITYVFPPYSCGC